jgi:hypothetical protein
MYLDIHLSPQQLSKACDPAFLLLRLLVMFLVGHRAFMLTFPVVCRVLLQNLKSEAGKSPNLIVVHPHPTAPVQSRMLEGSWRSQRGDVRVRDGIADGR